MFIEFKIITTCVPTCIVNRKRYIAQSMYHFVAQNYFDVLNSLLHMSGLLSCYLAVILLTHAPAARW